MSFQRTMTRQPRYKAYKPAPIIHHIEHPRGNGLRIYRSEDWSPTTSTDIVPQFSKYPKAISSTITLLSQRKASSHHHNKLLKQQPKPHVDPDTIEVYDGHRKTQELSHSLQISSLAGGIGIALTGRYAHGPRAGQHARDDAFMGHLVEGRMRETAKGFLGDVTEARKKGLEMGKVVVCYRDEETLAQDRRMVWNSRMVAEEVRLREGLVRMVEEALGEAPDLLPYHVLEEKTVCIGPERLIKCYKFGFESIL